MAAPLYRDRNCGKETSNAPEMTSGQGDGICSKAPALCHPPPACFKNLKDISACLQRCPLCFKQQRPSVGRLLHHRLLSTSPSPPLNPKDRRKQNKCVPGKYWSLSPRDSLVPLSVHAKLQKSQKCTIQSRGQKHTHATPAPGRPRQEDREFKGSPGHTARL